MIEKRRSRFAERLTIWMFVLAAIGAAIVILEPEIRWYPTESFSLHIGGHKFSDEMVGGVVVLVIIGTITALIRFWFPGSEIPPPQQGSVTTTKTVTEGENNATKP